MTHIIEQRRNCGQCGACDRAMVSVDVGNREIGDMEITQAAYAEAQMEISRLRSALEFERRECERAWSEVDVIAKERDTHARWRQELADDLCEVERHRDALAAELNFLDAVEKAARALRDNAEEYDCEGLGLFAQHGYWQPLHDALDEIDDRATAALEEEP